MKLRTWQWDKPSLANTPTPLHCGQHTASAAAAVLSGMPKSMQAKTVFEFTVATCIYSYLLQLHCCSAAAVTVAFRVHSKFSTVACIVNSLAW